MGMGGGWWGGGGGGFVGGGWGVVVGGDVGVWCGCGSFGGGAVEGDGLHVAGGVVWDGVVEGGVEFLVRHFGCLWKFGVVCSVAASSCCVGGLFSVVQLTSNLSLARDQSPPPCLTEEISFSKNQGRLFGGTVLSETERAETWETWKMEPGGIRH